MALSKEEQQERIAATRAKFHAFGKKHGDARRNAQLTAAQTVMVGVTAVTAYVGGSFTK